MASSIHLDDLHADVLHHTISRIAAADGFHQALDRVLDFAVEVVKCDSCFIYVLEGAIWFCGRPKIRTRSWWIG
jgi:hypothetical protein